MGILLGFCSQAIQTHKVPQPARPVRRHSSVEGVLGLCLGLPGNWPPHLVGKKHNEEKKSEILVRNL